jgi:hypothetical protein
MSETALGSGSPRRVGDDETDGNIKDDGTYQTLPKIYNRIKLGIYLFAEKTNQRSLRNEHATIHVVLH